MTSSPVLERLIILFSGICMGRFSDGISIWVGCSGRDAILVDDRGEPRHMVPEYAPRTQFSARSRFSSLFKIRNRYHPIPLALLALDIVPDGQISPSEIRSVSWPCYRNVEFVESICGRYRLSLDPISAQVTIEFPILVHGAHARGSYTIRQHWSTVDLPASWRHALLLAQNPICDRCDDIVTVDMRIATSTERLRSEVLHRNQNVMNLQNAYPDHDPVFIDWTPEVVYRVCGEGIGVDVLFKDGSVLKSHDLLFFTHSTTPPSMYSVGDLASTDLESDQLPIISSIHRAVRMLKLHRTIIAMGPANDLPANPHVSNRETQNVSIPSIGDFIAFADGRVTGRFYDRTIVDLDSSHSTCRILLPDGTLQSVRVVALDSASQLVPYVNTCMEFATWASMSLEQRLALEQRTQQRSALVETEVERNAWFLRRALATSSNQVENSRPVLAKDPAVNGKPDLAALTRQAMENNHIILQRISRH